MPLGRLERIGVFSKNNKLENRGKAEGKDGENTKAGGSLKRVNHLSRLRTSQRT